MSWPLCPIRGCDARCSVLDSRARDDYVRRRYVCASGHRFTTSEVVVPSKSGQHLKTHYAAKRLVGSVKRIDKIRSIIADLNDLLKET